LLKRVIFATVIIQKMAKYHTLFPVKNRNITDDSDNILFLTGVSFDQFANRAVNQEKWYFPFPIYLAELHIAYREDSQPGFINLAGILSGISQKPGIIFSSSFSDSRNKIAEIDGKFIKTGSNPERILTILNVNQHKEFLT